MYTLGELADRFGLTCSGNADRRITGLATLADAGPDELAFLANRKYLPQLSRTAAAAVILHPDLADQCPVDCLLAQAPYVAFARLTHLFDRTPAAIPGVNPHAVVSPEAEIHPEASVGPNAVVEAGAVLGPGVIIGAGVYIGHDSRLGAGTRVFPNAVIYHDVHIGERCVIHSQAVLGADGFGFAPGEQGWEKICQLGGVRVGDGVEIGACTTVDRGALGHTVIEGGAIIDNLVQVAHNVTIGPDTVIAAQSGVAGSSKIGARAQLGGQTGVAGHLSVADGVKVQAQSGIASNIGQEGQALYGSPAMPYHEYLRAYALFRKLPALQKRIEQLEKKLNAQGETTP